MEEKLFQYRIASVIPISKDKPHPHFLYKYEDVIIYERGDAWKSWSEKGSDYSYLLLRMKSVERAVELYMKHLGQVNQSINKLKEEAQKNWPLRKNIKMMHQTSMELIQ